MDKHTHTQEFYSRSPSPLSFVLPRRTVVFALSASLFVFRCFRWVWLSAGAGKVSERVKIVALGGPWEFPLPSPATSPRLGLVAFSVIFRFDEEFLSPSAKFVLNCRLAEL